MKLKRNFYLRRSVKYLNYNKKFSGASVVSYSRNLLASMLFLSLTGCTGLFFQASRDVYARPEDFGYQVKREDFINKEGLTLSKWIFPSKTVPKKGIVGVFHGNAENNSSHFASFAWLQNYGFDVYLIDYRGYGQSQGSASLDGIQRDVDESILFYESLAENEKLPLYLFGQSLGGSLLLSGLKRVTSLPQLKFILVESSFYSYQQIAREKLSGFWLSWPFQWLAYLLVSDKYQPGGGLDKLGPYQKLVAYMANDPVVPSHHTQKIFDEMSLPKTKWETAGNGHIATFFSNRGAKRPLLVKMMSETQ